MRRREKGRPAPQPSAVEHMPRRKQSATRPQLGLQDTAGSARGGAGRLHAQVLWKGEPRVAKDAARVLRGLRTHDRVTAHAMQARTVRGACRQGSSGGSARVHRHRAPTRLAGHRVGGWGCGEAAKGCGMAKMCSRRHFVFCWQEYWHLLKRCSTKDRKGAARLGIRCQRRSPKPVAINAGPLQPADREFAELRAQQARRAAPAVWRTSRHGP